MYVTKTRIRIYACACQKTRLTYFPCDAVKIKKNNAGMKEIASWTISNKYYRIIWMMRTRGKNVCGLVESKQDRFLTI